LRDEKGGAQESRVVLGFHDGRDFGGKKAEVVFGDGRVHAGVSGAGSGTEDDGARRGGDSDVAGGKGFGSGIPAVLESGEVAQRDRVQNAGRIRRRTWAGLRYAPSAPSSITKPTDSHKHWYIKRGQARVVATDSNDMLSSAAPQQRESIVFVNTRWKTSTEFFVMGMTWLNRRYWTLRNRLRNEGPRRSHFF